ncbi:AAA family ATPase [Hymenobacter persicinus]|uniref:ATP-binding protein n=1 Tax=Hymenobacter persicinus TaxID=2025506 RepID=A0A4Q5LFT3_9BACT|nr:ATP-binding protein [Hymenobacter persicinus]RYU83823.1 ATP-binding protein [Hymenobacter persicinus]
MEGLLHVPQELLQLKPIANDVSVLIGENGSGKSTLLNKLSHYFLENKKEVIAIANSIHDKFDSKSRRFYSLRGRSGRNHSTSVIKKAMANIARSDVFILTNSIRALNYVGFDPVMGFKVNNIVSDFEFLIIEYFENYDQAREVITLIDNYLHDAFYKRESVSSNGNREGIIWLEEGRFSYDLYDKYNLTNLFIWESKLRSLGVIDGIEVFLRRNGQNITMLNASSGELSLISSIVYLSTVITNDSVILIDEPENSLHPKWQKEYVKNILDLFYNYQPKVVVATHSPLIVNGAELSVKETKVYKAEGGEFSLQNESLLNVEEIFFKFFDLATPQNRFLSERLVRVLNVLEKNRMTLEEFQSYIERIKSESYDPKQIDVLNTIKILAENIKKLNKINEN